MKNEFQKRILSSLILIPTALFFILMGSILFNFFIFICLLITFYEWHMMSKKKAYYVFGFIFLLFSFYSIYELRNSFYGDYTYILIITLICVTSDIGGYIFGKVFKGPKLTKISPKKTYSGMIGGYLLSIISINLFNIFFNISLELDELIPKILIFAVLVSTFSQIGDIIISYFKRLSKIKDTGKIIPGHGGLLDRIDGMIFAFPFSYLILKLNLLNYL